MKLTKEISQDDLLAYLLRYATSRPCPHKVTYNDGFSDGKRELARQILEDMGVDYTKEDLASNPKKPTTVLPKETK